LSPAVSNTRIDNFYEIGLQNGIYGGKLLGSGGGGYILFFHPPKIKNMLERTLSENGGDILNFNFDNTGATVWNVCE
jgi:D-glycero-alpha-D-manno-heptose-7-phosphate kinase